MSYIVKCMQQLFCCTNENDDVLEQESKIAPQIIYETPPNHTKSMDIYIATSTHDSPCISPSISASMQDSSSIESEYEIISNLYPSN